jgi:hypothetical protein
MRAVREHSPYLIQSTQCFGIFETPHISNCIQIIAQFAFSMKKTADIRNNPACEVATPAQLLLARVQACLSCGCLRWKRLAATFCNFRCFLTPLRFNNIMSEIPRRCFPNGTRRNTGRAQRFPCSRRFGAQRFPCSRRNRSPTNGQSNMFAKSMFCVLSTASSNLHDGSHKSEQQFAPTSPKLWQA